MAITSRYGGWGRLEQKGMTERGWNGDGRVEVRICGVNRKGRLTRREVGIKVLRTSSDRAGALELKWQ
jgi:hypothetical protein